MPLESHLVHPSGQAETKTGRKAFSLNVVELAFLMWLPGISEMGERNQLLQRAGSKQGQQDLQHPLPQPATGAISLCSPVGLSPAPIVFKSVYDTIHFILCRSVFV